jgi:two-component system phosphate regulon sensor histidine kinase PhoR
MPNIWLKELLQFIWFGLIAAVLGSVLGYPFAVLFLYTLVYLGWYFYNLHRLEIWLRRGRKYAPPQSRGLWGEVLDGIYRLQIRSRKRSKRLVKLLNRFRETTGAMPDGIIVLQANGGIEWWNETAKALLNLRYPQDVGQRMNNLIRHPDFLAYLMGELEESDVVIPSPLNDQLILSIRIIPYGKYQQLVLIRDVTLMQKSDQMRRDFVANISHELRTPLTVMSGYIENLQFDSDDEQIRNHALEVMAQQARRMKQLTEDLMLLSSLENSQSSSRQEVVDVTRLLRSLQEEARIVGSEKQHDIQLELDEQVCLRSNPKELDSIFTNLVINAVNYTPEGGRIVIRWYADDHGAHFEVEDTGIGIAPHHLSRLTERFYRVDVARSRETGGSGLGLAIVKHAMQQNGGVLRIKSDLGRGSTFCCDFPFDRVVYKDKPDTQEQAI